MRYSKLIEDALLDYMQNNVDDDAPDDVVIGHIKGLQQALEILRDAEKGKTNE